MTHIEQAIRDAVEKGGLDLEIQSFLFEGGSMSNVGLARIFLDPAFWQALSKARWSNVIYGRSPGAPREYWQAKWHDFINHLAEGKDAESFFKDLE